MSEINRNRSNSRKKLLLFIQFSMLLAIEAIVCFTPLGSLPIGPLVATLSHIPVVITAVSLGVGSGAAMGFAFGLFSFIVWTFMPPAAPMAFVFTPFYQAGPMQGNFWSLVICFVPRILLGVIAGLTTKFFETRFPKRAPLGYVLAGVFASIAHTILVLGGIYLFFGAEYAEVNGMAFEALLAALATVVATNGVLEAVLAGVLGVAVAVPVKKIMAKQAF